MEGEETERWQEYLGVTRVSEGKNDRKRLQGWWREGGESFKGIRQQGRVEVAGGRLTGGQKKRSPIKVGRGGCEQWHQELWRERSEAKKNVPALAVMPFTLRNLAQLPGASVCVCVGGENCYRDMRVHQTGTETSQDTCPTVALVVFRQRRARRPLPEWRASTAAFPPGRLSVTVIFFISCQEEDTQKHQAPHLLQEWCLNPLDSGEQPKQISMSGLFKRIEHKVIELFLRIIFKILTGCVHGCKFYLNWIFGIVIIK